MAAVFLACSAQSAPVAVTAARPAKNAKHQPALIGSLRVPILMYHHVGPAASKWRPLYVGYPQFVRQMEAIAASGVVTVTLDELVSAIRGGRSFPKGAVALTFDDGTSDQYELVYPILKRYRLHATFYVAPGLFGRAGYMTWAQARTIAEGKLVAFEAHTLRHADLTRITPDEARVEVVEGKKLLEHRLGIHVRHFAYPYGHVNDAVQALVRSAGFITAVTTKYAWSHDAKQAMTWGRITVHETNDPANLAILAQSSGAYSRT